MKQYANKVSVPALIVIVVLLIAAVVLFNGLIVLAVWNVFNLSSLVAISYWQATGIGLILSLFNLSNTTSRK